MLEPDNDERYRVFRSERLWVIERRFKEAVMNNAEILGSIERKVLTIEGRQGEFVQYKNRFKPLHTKEEFEEILMLSKEEKIYLFSHELSVSQVMPETISQLKPAPFIFIDE